eukprot:TRINITY_DN12712_c0_g1_i1.p1 TRINITY_DN12712_c0_g1~~TRINITY_DN12712_c0_g1_i1.p1  ORF type:complete len:739 (+),score=155.07 TRINITY_DN12712_c0_g1_i1:186-2402(+)
MSSSSSTSETGGLHKRRMVSDKREQGRKGDGGEDRASLKRAHEGDSKSSSAAPGSRRTTNPIAHLIRRELQRAIPLLAVIFVFALFFGGMFYVASFFLADMTERLYDEGSRAGVLLPNWPPPSLATSSMDKQIMLEIVEKEIVESIRYRPQGVNLKSVMYLARLGDGDGGDGDGADGDNPIVVARPIDFLEADQVLSMRKLEGGDEIAARGIVPTGDQSGEVAGSAVDTVRTPTANRWKYVKGDFTGWAEVAAYHLDRALGMFKKPVTVGKRITKFKLRRVNGFLGRVQTLLGDIGLFTNSVHQTIDVFMQAFVGTVGPSAVSPDGRTIPNKVFQAILPIELVDYLTCSERWTSLRDNWSQTKLASPLIANLPVKDVLKMYDGKERRSYYKFHSDNQLPFGVPTTSEEALLLLSDISDVIIFDFLVDDRDRGNPRNWVGMRAMSHLDLNNADNTTNVGVRHRSSRLVLLDSGLSFEGGPLSNSTLLLAPWSSWSVLWAQRPWQDVHRYIPDIAANVGLNLDEVLWPGAADEARKGSLLTDGAEDLDAKTFMEQRLEQGWELDEKKKDLLRKREERRDKKRGRIPSAAEVELREQKDEMYRRSVGVDQLMRDLGRSVCKDCGSGEPICVFRRKTYTAVKEFARTNGRLTQVMRRTLAKDALAPVFNRAIYTIKEPRQPKRKATRRQQEREPKPSHEPLIVYRFPEEEFYLGIEMRVETLARHMDDCIARHGEEAVLLPF